MTGAHPDLILSGVTVNAPASKRTTARIPHETYKRMVEFFRREPGATKRCSRILRVHYNTAHRAWHEGWPNPEWAREPIKNILVEEMRGVRAVANEQAEAVQAQAGAQRIKEREQARLDVLTERSREAHAIRATLSAAITNLATVGTLSKMSVPVAEYTQRKVMESISTGVLKTGEGLSILSKLSALAREAGSNLASSMQMIRLHLGEPNQIIGSVGDPAHKANAVLAYEQLGPELVRKAVIDILDGRVSEEADQLLRWQVEQELVTH